MHIVHTFITVKDTQKHISIEIDENRRDENQTDELTFRIKEYPDPHSDKNPKYYGKATVNKNNFIFLNLPDTFDSTELKSLIRVMARMNKKSRL